MSEATTRGVLQEKVFSKILEISQENTCIGFSLDSLFNKVAGF